MMKYKRKKSISIKQTRKIEYLKYIFLILLGCIICSCSSKNDKTEIVFWAMGAEGEYVQKLIPEFEARNKDISVKVQMIPWTAAQEKLITAYASDNMPDVFQLGNTWIPQFVALNAIIPIDDFLAESDSISHENYFGGIWGTNVLSGKAYGVPWYIDTRVLYYRKDILKKAGFDSPPKTWDELYSMSKKIKALYPEEDKYAIYLPTNEWAPFIIWGLQNKAKLLIERDSKANFTSKKFKEAFSYLINFHKEKLAPIGISQVNNIYQAFAEEYIAMYISGPWNVREFKKKMIGELADKWLTAPLPAPDSSYPGISLAGGASLVISKNSEKKNEAWKFVEYLSEESTQIKFYKMLGSLPAVKKAWNDSTLQNDKYMKAFEKQFENVKATPKILEWERIAFSKIQQYAEYTARNAMSVEEALKLLDKDVDKILEKRRWLLSK